MSKSVYVHPEVLWETGWAVEHLEDPGLRFVEVDVDTTAYAAGHIPGAIGWNWQRDTQDTLRRDIIDQQTFEELLSRSSIANDTMVILYGDHNNWFATYAFWLLNYYGHERVRLINGGRVKWQADGLPLTTEVSQPPRTNYKVNKVNPDLRARRDFVLSRLGRGDLSLVDVRSPQEFSGELLAPEHLPQEGSQRGGHIPGAANITWSKAVQNDGTFKTLEELRALYESQGVRSDQEVITYCRIGERSSHTWFVLRYLLGYPHVRNYDGSWTEWGSLIGVPIEKNGQG